MFFQHLGFSHLRQLLACWSLHSLYHCCSFCFLKFIVTFTLVDLAVASPTTILSPLLPLHFHLPPPSIPSPAISLSYFDKVCNFCLVESASNCLLTSLKFLVHHMQQCVHFAKHLNSAINRLRSSYLPTELLSHTQLLLAAISPCLFSHFSLQIPPLSCLSLPIPCFHAHHLPRLLWVWPLLMTTGL